MRGSDVVDEVGDQRTRSRWLPEYIDADQLFVVGASLLMFSACSSSISSVSTVAAGAGVIALVPATLDGRSHPVTRSVVALGLFWLVYGLVVGSLPSLNRPSQLIDFAETEGRALLVLGIIAATQGIRSVTTFDATLRWLVWIVTALAAAGIVFDLVGLIDATRGNVYAGLASSHHVVGFAAALAITVLFVRPEIIGLRWVRWMSFAVLALSLALSGSRSSMLAVAACAVVTWIHKRNLRSLVIPMVAALVLVGLGAAASPRVSDTVEIFASTDFWSDARTAWNDGTKDGARALAENEAQGNLLIRFAFWGAEASRFVDSPIVGYGRFRTNDVDLSYSGVQGVVYVATSGERAFNDSQPHNQLIFVLAETGVVGLGLATAPFIIAWRRTRRRDDALGASLHSSEASESVVDAERRSAEWTGARLLFVVGALALFVVGLSSAGLLTTGFGIGSALVVFGSARVAEVTLRSVEGSGGTDSESVGR